nr:immunoglobulin heavy chain junction region [Macaca mulatta]
CARVGRWSWCELFDLW